MKLNTYKKATVLWLIIIVLVVFSLPMAAKATSSWQAKYTRFSATAGETLAVGNVVCIKSTDGKAYLASNADTTLRPAVGIVDKGGSSGYTVEIVATGILAGQTSASPGATVYLSTAGGLTTTVANYAQKVGWVLPGTAGTNYSTKYFISIGSASTGGVIY